METCNNPLQLVKIFKSVSFVIILSLIFLTTPKIAFGQVVLLQESFENNTGLGSWDTTAGWKIVNNEYWGETLKGESPQLATAGDFTWQDYTLEVSVRSVDGIDRHILFRYDPSRGSGKEGYWFKYTDASYGNPESKIELGKGSAGSLVGPFAHPNFSSHLGDTHTFRIEVKSNQVKISELKSDGALSPLIEYEDKNYPLLSGKVGFFVQSGNFDHDDFKGSTVTAYDNLIVYTPPVLENGLEIPDLKQYHPQWKDEIYNNATHWAPSDPTIEFWGCALTSASMLLQYFGHDVYPDELNTWLKNSTDGYIRGGLLNWLAVSRYSLQNSQLNSSVLEFQRQKFEAENLSSNLNSKIPSIVQIPGHFVVVKGKIGSEYLVNDPASEIQFLSSVQAQRSKEASSIIYYLPTHTDLSYIMLVSDGDTEIKLFDSVGNIIPTSSVVEHALSNNFSSTITSGSDLRIVYLQKPREGNYLIKILGGNGPFLLEAYLYNSRGDLISEEPLSYVGNNSVLLQDNVKLVYKNGNQDLGLLYKNITYDSLLYDLEILYLIGRIDKYDVYLGLRDKLVVSRLLALDKHKKKPAEKVLQAFLKQLRAQRFKHIDNLAYNYLVDAIHNLDKSF